MPTKIAETVSSGVSQKDFRKLVTVRDQHKCARFPEGRPWYGYVEQSADRKIPDNFVQELMPGDHEDPWNSVWEAPWMPDQRFKRLDVVKGRVEWLYGDMMNDLERLKREYYGLVTEVGYEKGWPVPEYGAPVDHRYLRVVGPLPESPKLPQAALAGDPYILGFSPNCDDDMLRVALATKARRFLPPPVVAEPERADPEIVTVRKSDIAQMIKDGIEAALKEQAQSRMAKARAAKETSKAA